MLHLGVFGAAAGSDGNDGMSTNSVGVAARTARDCTKLLT